MDLSAEQQQDAAAPGPDRRGRDRRTGDRRTGEDRREAFPGEQAVSESVRSRAAAGLVRGLQALVKWTVAVVVLVAVGAVVVWKGWTLLAGAGADDRTMPSPGCVERAVADAERFASVLGDDREVDRAALKASCVPRS